MFSGKSGAVRLSVVVVIGLIIVKVGVSAVTGSLGVLAQAVDSFLDLFAVIVTFLAIRIAARPADADHPFGHGKAENVAAIVQSVLIFLAGGTIIYSAVQRARTEAALELTEAGIAVMVVSVIASIFLSRHLRKVARREDSMALAANADNIAADVYSASAVLVGLIIVRFTGWDIVDDILGGIVGLFILKVGVDVLRNSFGGLVDVKLPEDEEAAIRAAIIEHAGVEVVNFHKLRTRKAGSHRYIDVHLVMPRSISLDTAHEMCDHLETDIQDRLIRTDVTIHVEPCDDDCPMCEIIACEDRKD
ncbi:MAG: cation diffusion facilitator family transporter [Dehalococcoidales bacterium]|nr:cation diffusion facilitator family transporter [Dehalococcoidales bacterium]